MSRVISSADALGIPFQLGQESQFLSSLQEEGLGGRHLQTLERIISSRPVKLYAYRDVVEALESFRDDRAVRGDIERDYREELREARHWFSSLHNQAIGALRVRGLVADFWGHCIAMVPLLLEMDYVSPAGVRDLSYEYRHYVEDRGFEDLFDVAQRYLWAAADVADAQADWKNFKKTPWARMKTSLTSPETRFSLTLPRTDRRHLKE